MTSGQRLGLDRYRRTLEGLLGIPFTEGNTVEVLRNGVRIFPAMLEAIRGATHTVDLCTYVYWTGDVALAFAEACSDRARAGVRVRILLDAVGALQMNRDLVHQMEDAGCVVEWFREPARMRGANNRTHRKVLVCDEEVAFTGGVGIAEEWEGDARSPSEWRDTHVQVRGPAVDGLRAAFATNWAETGRPLFTDADRFPDQPQDGRSVVQVVQCPSQVGWGLLASAFAAMLKLAQERVRITTAYFVPDDRFLQLIIETVERGIEVDVLVPGEHIDKRVVQVAGEADYEPLLEAGVRIWRYRPTMLHAKVITVDGALAVIGSANFDPRSLRANEEANLVILDPEVVRILDEHFAEDLARSDLVDAEAWKRRGPLQRAGEAVADLFDEQL